MYYVVYIDMQRHYRWTLYSANGNKIANSGEGYVNKSDCLHAINLVKTSYSAPVRQP